MEGAPPRGVVVHEVRWSRHAGDTHTQLNVSDDGFAVSALAGTGWWAARGDGDAVRRVASPSRGRHFFPGTNTAVWTPFGTQES